MLVRLGDSAEARRQLRQLEDARRTRYAPADGLTATYLALGDIARALAMSRAGEVDTAFTLAWIPSFHCSMASVGPRTTDVWWSESVSYGREATANAHARMVALAPDWLPHHGIQGVRKIFVGCPTTHKAREALVSPSNGASHDVTRRTAGR